MENYIFQWSEGESLVLFNCWAKCFCELSKYIGKDTDMFGVVETRNVTTFITKQNAEVSAEFSKRFLEAEFQKEFLLKIDSAKTDFDSLFSELRATKLHSLSNEQLAVFLEKFESCIINTAVPFAMMQAEFTDYPHKIIKEAMKKTGGSAVEEDLSILLMPDEMDVIKREELAFSKLGKNPSQEALLAHCYEYAVLFYNSYNELQNIDFLRSRLSRIKPFSELKKEFEAEQKHRKALQLKLEAKLNADTKRAVQFLRTLGLQRLELKDKWAGAEFRFLSLFKEVSKRMSIGLNDVFSVYSIPELIAFLRNEPRVEETKLRQRKQFYTVTVKAGKVSIVEGEEAKVLVQKHLPEYFVRNDVREIRGGVANPGKVTAKAYVVKVVGIAELSNAIKEFEQGAVLVTTMTQPNMVPLMRKASAVVTDEGGMTSHAAVLSREFGVPCIVGTHIATKAIKTRDLIEVDANNGIIRKIE